MCLANLKLKTISDGNNDSLKEYVTLASKANKDEKEDNDFKDVKTALRKQIVDAFKKGGSYSDLFKKELIQVHLRDFVTDEQEKQMVENFGKFTTYFTGFNENRQNMYSDEEKSTSIAYRLIHENLPMFIDNIKSFAKIAEHEDIDFLPDIENGFKEELKRLKAQNISEVFDLANFTNTLTQSQIDSYNAIIGARHDENGDKVQGINQYVNLYNQKNKDARLPLLKPLYKMILSDRVALSWLPEEFATDEEMLNAINEAHENLKSVLEKVRVLLLNIGNYS
jgi:CRISPR-associated protein Cpf1